MAEGNSQQLAKEANRTLKRIQNFFRLLSGKKTQVGATPNEVVFARNKLRLLRYLPPEDAAPRNEDAPPVLVVPSVINRPYILDLQPGKSLIEYLLRSGLDVFVVDWGRPRGEDRHLTFADHIESLLHGAVCRACRLTGHDRVAVLGQCIGGMLALTYAGLHPERIASLANLTSPVDLSQGGTLFDWTSSMDADLMVDALGNAPWPLLQTSFHMLTPTALPQKTVWFFDRLWDQHSVDTFVALETWANDNVSIPGEFFRFFVKEFYQKNALHRGTLKVNGRKVDLSQLEAPVLNVAAEEDHIAPPESVTALADLVPHTRNYVLGGGHIGAIVSYRAGKKLWPELVAFFSGRTDEHSDEEESSR